MQQEQNSARNVQDSAKSLSCDEGIGKNEEEKDYCKRGRGSLKA